MGAEVFMNVGQFLKISIGALFILGLVGCQWLKNPDQNLSETSTDTGTRSPSEEGVFPAKSGDFFIEPLPPVEAQFWSQKVQNDSSLGLAFPVDPKRDVFGIRVGTSFTAVWKFSPEMETQLQEWSGILNNTDDCVSLGKKLGRDLSRFDECLQAAKPEDRQILMAQRIYAKVQIRLKRTEPGNDQRLAFRGIVDRRGKLQAVFFSDKHPDLETYRRYYGSAIPPQAKQIPAIEIHHLLVAPWNLLAEHPYKVSGAGTAALSFAAYESQRTPYRGRILLESVPTAIKFYEKAGFKPFGETFSAALHSYLPVMLLNETRARQLVEKHAVAAGAPCGQSL